MYDDHTLLVLESDNRFIDTHFFFDIEENCPNIVDVQVMVQMNERHEEKSVILMNRQDSLGVQQADVIVAPTRCSTTNSANTQGTWCKPDADNELRFYIVTVTATDSVGNMDSSTCNIVVAPIGVEPNVQPVVPDFSSARQLYKAAEVLSLEWDNELAPSDSPSTSPSISSSPTTSLMPSASPTKKSSKSSKGD